MVDIMTNHAEFPDPLSKMSARALLALDEDDMPGLKAALDCIRVISCAATRDEAMDLAERVGVPWSIRTSKRKKRSTT